MAVRETLADLITELRQAIGDAAGGAAVFTDEQLQRFLDRKRREIFSQYLEARQTRDTNGARRYRHYESPDKYWEASAVFTDSGFNPIAPGEADYLTGRFVFAADRAAIYVSGFIYDLPAAAADACEAWAAKEKMNFDFSADGQSYRESQKWQTLRQMAQDFRAQSVFAVGKGAYISGDWN